MCGRGGPACWRPGVIRDTFPASMGKSTDASVTLGVEPNDKEAKMTQDKSKQGSLSADGESGLVRMRTLSPMSRPGVIRDTFPASMGKSTDASVTLGVEPR